MLTLSPMIGPAPPGRGPIQTETPMQIATLLTLLFSVLMPAKQWFAPGEPIAISNGSNAAIQLVLTDFQGGQIGTDVPSTVEPGQSVDLKVIFPNLRVGTYVVYAVPPGKTTQEFVGTPLLLSLRGDPRPGMSATLAGTRIEPLSIAKFTTTAGEMQAAFYYDFAPNTVANFVNLARGGFYDGLRFHRVVPDFIVQAGDPNGDNSGGPGYQIEAEFNGRPHLPGVLSMAREGDPMESQGAMPRPEFANTAGSQFFVALDYAKTRRLDNRYTAFGKVIGDNSMATLKKIGGGAVADATTGRPAEPVTITKLEIIPVTPETNPYLTLMSQAQIAEERKAE